MKKGLGGTSWFSRVGWEGSWECSTMKHEKRVWVLHGSHEWGGKGSGKAQNEA